MGQIFRRFGDLDRTIRARLQRMVRTLTQNRMGVNALAVVCLFWDKMLIPEDLVCNCSAQSHVGRGPD
jgi:hypothetical protein